MNECVLDASAVLAILQNERGREMVEARIERSVIGRINFVEILTTLVNKGMLLDAAIEALDSLDLTVIELDRAQSIRIAELRPLTRHLGFSLGDRACLALAIGENATAVTADRNWVGTDVCQIESIR